MKNKNYPLYNVAQVKSLKELVRYTAEHYGSQNAFTYKRKNKIVHISYTQFKQNVDSLVTAFLDLGISDMKIAVIGENSYEWILTYFGGSQQREYCCSA